MVLVEIMVLLVPLVMLLAVALEHKVTVTMADKVVLDIYLAEVAVKEIAATTVAMVALEDLLLVVEELRQTLVEELLVMVGQLKHFLVELETQHVVLEAVLDF
jgi:hypothetical protein